MRRVERAGFTVIELMVALAIGGMALGAAGLLFQQIASTSDRVLAQAAATAYAGNGDRLLRSALRQYDTIADTVASFDGREDRVWLTTWCATPSGWPERCDAMVAIDTTKRQRVLAIVLSTGEGSILRRGFDRATFLYRRDRASSGTWLRGWARSTSAPAALGIVVDADTLILPVGGDR